MLVIAPKRVAEDTWSREHQKWDHLKDLRISKGNTGVPDRIVILPSGDIFFVELKTDTGRLSGPQDYWQFRLKDLNCVAVVLYGFDQVDWFLKQIGPYAWAEEIRDMIGDLVDAGNNP